MQVITPLFSVINIIGTDQSPQ